MKLQLQGQNLRLRVDEAELAMLLSGKTVVNRILLGKDCGFSQSLSLRAGVDVEATPILATRDQAWHVELPMAAVVAYADQLPCRHALAFVLELGEVESIRLDFEVDVRDSMKSRGPRRRAEVPG